MIENFKLFKVDDLLSPREYELYSIFVNEFRKIDEKLWWTEKNTIFGEPTEWERIETLLKKYNEHELIEEYKNAKENINYGLWEKFNKIDKEVPEFSVQNFALKMNGPNYGEAPWHPKDIYVDPNGHWRVKWTDEKIDEDGFGVDTPLVYYLNYNPVDIIVERVLFELGWILKDEYHEIPDVFRNSYKGHVNVYPTGGYMKKHRDGNADRLMIILIYPNIGVKKEDGGILNLWEKDEKQYSILPNFNNVVVINHQNSDPFHEVTVNNSTSTRYSYYNVLMKKTVEDFFIKRN
jgi:hypothetical protein